MDEFDVEDVVNNAVNGDVADLERAFDSVMRQKINQALEFKKQEFGQSLGSTEEDE